jgi:hypothetical protein
MSPIRTPEEKAERYSKLAGAWMLLSLACMTLALICAIIGLIVDG